jgi:hypothetical protein
MSRFSDVTDGDFITGSVKQVFLLKEWSAMIEVNFMK